MPRGSHTIYGSAISLASSDDAMRSSGRRPDAKLAGAGLAQSVQASYAWASRVIATRFVRTP